MRYVIMKFNPKIEIEFSLFSYFFLGGKGRKDKLVHNTEVDKGTENFWLKRWVICKNSTE